MSRPRHCLVTRRGLECLKSKGALDDRPCGEDQLIPVARVAPIGQCVAAIAAEPFEAACSPKTCDGVASNDPLLPMYDLEGSLTEFVMTGQPPRTVHAEGGTDPAEHARFRVRDACIFWTGVKELNLNYHNRDI